MALQVPTQAHTAENGKAILRNYIFNGSVSVQIPDRHQHKNHFHRPRRPQNGHLQKKLKRFLDPSHNFLYVTYMEVSKNEFHIVT